MRNPVKRFKVRQKEDKKELFNASTLMSGVLKTIEDRQIKGAMELIIGGIENLQSSKEESKNRKKNLCNDHIFLQTQHEYEQENLVGITCEL